MPRLQKLILLLIPLNVPFAFLCRKDYTKVFYKAKSKIVYYSVYTGAAGANETNTGIAWAEGCWFVGLGAAVTGVV